MVIYLHIQNHKSRYNQDPLDNWHDVYNARTKGDWWWHECSSYTKRRISTNVFSQREIRMYVYLLTSIQEKWHFELQTCNFNGCIFVKRWNAHCSTPKNIYKLRSLECKRLGEFRYSYIQDENINIYSFPKKSW